MEGSYNVDDHHRVMGEKINNAFRNVRWPGLIRFWVPVKKTSPSEHSMLVYRLCCIDNLNKLKEKVDKEMMLISGPPANAILNHLPEIVLDLSVYKGNPLVDSALECGFTCSMFLPVSMYCVIGILECSMILCSDLLRFFSGLKTALLSFHRVGFHLQECHPYKAVCGLKAAQDEIEKAFEIVYESHDLTLAQVWINYETDNHMSKFGVKLIGYSADIDADYSYENCVMKGYIDACDVFPLKLGEGPAGKTLQTSEPLFCINVNLLTDNGGLLGLLPANYECSYLVISLRSIHTRDLNYAFEFFWLPTRDYQIVSESLLSTLKRCLPSFTFSFGADADNSLNNALELRHKWIIKKGIFSLDVNCKTTLIPSPPSDNEELTTIMEGHFGVSEWQGRNMEKRMSIDFHETESRSTGKSSASSINRHKSTASSSDKSSLIIKAEYEDDLIVFHLPVSSATIAAVKKKIDEGFNLNGSFTLEYWHVLIKTWLIMESDQHVKCSFRYNHRIRLKVLPSRSLQSSHVLS